MKIDNKISVTFDQNFIEEMIREKLKENGYDVVGKINFCVSHRRWTEGIGQMERDREETVFTGAQVDVVKTR